MSWKESVWRLEVWIDRRFKIFMESSKKEGLGGIEILVDMVNSSWGIFRNIFLWSFFLVVCNSLKVGIEKVNS